MSGGSLGQPHQGGFAESSRSSPAVALFGEFYATGICRDSTVSAIMDCGDESLSEPCETGRQRGRPVWRDLSPDRLLILKCREECAISVFTV